MSYLWHLCPLVAVAGLVYAVRKSEKVEEQHQKTMNESMEKLNKIRKEFQEARIDFTKQFSSTRETANSFKVAEESHHDELKKFMEALRNVAPPSSQVDEGAGYIKEV